MARPLREELYFAASLKDSIHFFSVVGKIIGKKWVEIIIIMCVFFLLLAISEDIVNSTCRKLDMPVPKSYFFSFQNELTLSFI